MNWNRMLGVAVLGLCTASLSAGEEQQVQMSQVPTAAWDAASKAAEGVRFTQAAMEMEQGKKVYELSGKNFEGCQYEVDVTADGKVLEVEQQITIDEVPATVRRAIERRAQQFQAKKIEKSIRPYQGVWYEFEGQNGQGEHIDLEISSCGTMCKIELEDDTDQLAQAHSEESEMPLQEVPQEIRSAASQKVRNVEWTKAFTEHEDGQLVYELQGRDQDGRQIEVDITADAQILEVEREIELEDAPQQVQQALARQAEGFTVEFAERSERPESVWYEFEGRNAKGQQCDIEIHEDGRQLAFEEEDDHDQHLQASSQDRRQPRQRATQTQRTRQTRTSAQGQ
ncbi:Hypothetical protein PBC10988_27170 [Planctomycetales bacterium 10988]|nr:Hypothetical protein PBC10988_27170 [Planctomycetales bacterium 10988]